MPSLITPEASPVRGGVEFATITAGRSEADAVLDGDGGFRSLAHFATTVARTRAKTAVPDSDRDLYRRWTACNLLFRNHLIDSREAPGIQRAIAVPDGMSENADPDGGSLIPPHFVREIWDKARFRATPMSMCKTIVVPGNSGVLPGIYESSRVDGSRWGGALGYWEGEAQQGVKTWPKLMDNEYRLKKLFVMVPVTDELFDDAPMLDGFLTDVASKEFAYQCNNVIMHGTGAGMNLGMVGSPATISVARETNQTAATISPANVQAMWTQFHGPSRANGVWFANEEFDPDTIALPVTPATGWTVPVEAPSIKGRPVHCLENCLALGTPGDLVLCDPSQYLLILGGLRKAISIHLRFDVMESYFRFIYRIDGQSLWPVPLTSVYGTKPKSPYLTIQQR